jgi:hypothetical protein
MESLSGRAAGTSHPQERIPEFGKSAIGLTADRRGFAVMMMLARQMHAVDSGEPRLATS